jgi:predicted RNase H-like HicB family nuclease
MTATTSGKHYQEIDGFKVVATRDCPSQPWVGVVPRLAGVTGSGHTACELRESMERAIRERLGAAGKKTEAK